MRNFVNTQNKNLARDSKGQRTGFKVYIKVRKPMSDEGFKRLGVKLRVNFGKHKLIWKYYTCSRHLGYPDGIPAPLINCSTNKALGTWLITYGGLSNGEVYAIHSWRGKSMKHKIPVLTKALAIIEVQDVEKMAFKFSKDGRLKRFWFRKQEDKNKTGETQ